MNPRAGVIAGAFGYALMCAVAVPGPAHAADTQGTTLAISLAKSRLAIGQPVRASGHVGRDLAGRTVELEFRTRAGEWTSLGRTQVDAGGRYRIARALPRSGRVRVVLNAPAGAATASSGPVTSRERSVAVTARVGVSARRLHVMPGRQATLSGRVTPGTAGVRVRLQVRSGSGWRTVARTRTATGGGYRLVARARGSRSASARVTVAAHSGLAGADRPVGRLAVYRRSVASWYGPGFYGQRTGCGGRLGTGQLGVAHKTLPCGTRVTLRHRGRSVTVRVIDRGPYVGGREFDLTAATARRIGFRGHGPILVAG